MRLEPRSRERDEPELELLELFETDLDFDLAFSISSSISPASFWCPFCSAISDVFSATLSSRLASRAEPLALSSIELLLLLVGLDSSVDSLALSSSELGRDGDEWALREPDRERSAAGDCDFRLETIVANFCFLWVCVKLALKF